MIELPERLTRSVSVDGSLSHTDKKTNVFAMHAFPTDGTAPAASPHPKDVLYENVYDPLTVAWFTALAESPDVERLLSTASDYDLLSNLQRFNTLFQQLVDVTFVEVCEKGPDVLSLAYQYREGVLWVGNEDPGHEPDIDEFRSALGHKAKRNIILGIVEALLCLESAYTYAHEALRLRGEDLAGTLQRSRQLCSSLAMLHDEQEQVRLTFLTGMKDFLKYPEVDYPDVLDHSVHIPAEKFMVTGPAGSRSLKFVSVPLGRVKMDSPAKRCPAHRFSSGTHVDLKLSDVLWNLLIDLYRASGKFD
jgi:hypothetical protein